VKSGLMPARADARLYIAVAVFKRYIIRQE
jgi:hypothetical protein